jgi:hypothetical protein
MPKDLSMVRDISPLICETLRLSESLGHRVAGIEAFRRQCEVVSIACRSITKFIETSVEPTKILRDTATQLFGSETCFVCEFTGSEMIYYPTTVSWPFDDCVSGRAFNYRELSMTEYGDLNPAPALYNGLGVKVHRVVAFPLRRRGKIVGAFELVNPDPNTADEFARETIATLGVLFFPRIGAAIT